MGSASDPDPVWGKYPVNSIVVAHVQKSAHKSPLTCVELLNNLQKRYKKGVIIAFVGMSNGLGPMLAARCPWPVICVCTTLKDFQNDVWSSIRAPSAAPVLLSPDANNAYLSALSIHAESNPEAYAVRVMQIEENDP